MSYSEDPILDNIWVATTGNDGAKWATPSKIIPRNTDQTMTGDGTYTDHAFYFLGMAAVRTYDDLTLVAIEHTIGIQGSSFWYDARNGARASLAIVNYIAVGTSAPLGSSIVFKGSTNAIVHE